MIQTQDKAKESVTSTVHNEAHRWKQIGPVLVSFTVPGPIHDRRWDRFLADIERIQPRYCLTLCLGRVQVAAGQRLRSTRTLMRTGSRVAVLTNDRMTRGLAMGVAWFGAPLDGYSWDELDLALGRFDIDAALRDRLREEAQVFREHYARYDHDTFS
ncbi:MAG: hypothetical protein K0V04_34935 [Deltaproteobacteria bacterium]|nr:hypothetical protein [Deltaproteobacteria bacterium]